MTAFKVAVAVYAALNLFVWVIRCRQGGYTGGSPWLLTAIGLWATYLLVG